MVMGKIGRGLAVAGAFAAIVAFTGITPANADHGGISTGAAVGLGLGSFALGTAVGSAAANPYYGYPYGYYPQPAPAYYPAAPYYPAPRSCWDPYRRYYYAC